MCAAVDCERGWLLLAIVSKLLKDTGVDEETHPALVGLLELAARGSGIPSGSAQDTPAMRKRLLRQWQAVCDAFRKCVAVGVVNDDVIKGTVNSFQDLGVSHWAADGREWWQYSGPPYGARPTVAKALERVVSLKAGGLRKFEIRTVSDLRKAQKENGLGSFVAPILDCPGRVETAMDEGRGVVVSWPLFGKRLFCALVADEFGKVRAIGFRETRLLAMECLVNRQNSNL